MSKGLLREQPAPRSQTGVVLCADDFAMTNGISRAIVELADAGRISATSAMTNSAHWPSHATWLARIRGQIAVGLHLNLTLGSPLGPMPNIAPNRQFPALSAIAFSALAGTVNRAELRAEIERQVQAFESELGFPPDHIDGHQHVHALPVIRTVLLDVLKQRYRANQVRPLLRDPSDNVLTVLKRGRARRKTLALVAMSKGFRAAAKSAGFSCNEGFGGVTDFSANQAGVDFAAANIAPGPRQMVMCHPGFVDDELTRLDPVTGRRQREFDALMRGDFAAPLWRPRRTAGGGCIVWSEEWTGAK